MDLLLLTLISPTHRYQVYLPKLKALSMLQVKVFSWPLAACKAEVLLAVKASHDSAINPILNYCLSRQPLSN